MVVEGVSIASFLVNQPAVLYLHMLNHFSPVGCVLVTLPAAAIHRTANRIVRAAHSILMRRTHRIIHGVNTLSELLLVII